MTDNLKSGNGTGLMIFGLLVLVFLIMGLATYTISGHMGIEDRFNSAVGISGEGEEEEGSGFLGFNIEGNQLYYLIIFAALAILCAVLYLKFKL
ncbi:MAG: hypothetical protein AB9879_11935 [Methanothrix sp.]